jgi:hypothetical protein
MDSWPSLLHLSFISSLFHQINDANGHDHRDRHTDKDDESESHLKGIPDEYFNGHRRPVLVQKNSHEKQKYQNNNDLG